MTQDQQGQFITVEREQLPDGHDFVIVHRKDADEVTVFVAADDEAQRDARDALAAWVRSRGDRTARGSSSTT